MDFILFPWPYSTCTCTASTLTISFNWLQWIMMIIDLNVNRQGLHTTLAAVKYTSSSTAFNWIELSYRKNNVAILLSATKEVSDLCIFLPNQSCFSLAELASLEWRWCIGVRSERWSAYRPPLPLISDADPIWSHPIRQSLPMLIATYRHRQSAEEASSLTQ